MSGVSENVLEEMMIEHLQKVGWDYVHGSTINPGEPQAEREDFREVVLKERLLQAISNLNPELDFETVHVVANAALRAQSEVALTENWRTYQLLVGGVPVEVRNANGELRTYLARLVDFNDPSNNDLLAVNQFTVKGRGAGARTRRADLVLFVNGLPMVLVELKNPDSQHADIRQAFNQIQTYKKNVPELFTWNQLCVISDGHFARAGTFTAPREHFAPWKADWDGTRHTGHINELDLMTQGMLNREVLLDLVHSYVSFLGDGLMKRVAKYHQYWAVRKAVDCTLEAKATNRRAGVVWHTQGAGKSMEMLHYVAKIMRHPEMKNPTVVVITDRNDLDSQLFDEEFAASRIGAPLPEKPEQAEDRRHLKTLLSGRQSGGIIFSTLQKFGLSKEERADGIQFPLLSDRENIVVVVDEAHRSNYDLIDGFARHLRDGLPSASFIGFTGTPIDSDDKSTRQIFGEYIDIYDMTQATADGATVRVLYEPRLIKIDVPETNLASLDAQVQAATLSVKSDEERQRLNTRWSKVEAIVGSESRIKQLAADFVEHWDKRREATGGKAMLVGMSRRICVALYDAIIELRPHWHDDDANKGGVKVIMTGSAGDPESLQDHVLSKEDQKVVKKRAKDPDDALHLVIVRDMWLTGFDAPPMNTMYVDKPMKGASLMQSIARVNRRFRDKDSGLVVDYLGIAEDLKSALTNYTRRDQDNHEVGQDIRDSLVPKVLELHGVVSDMLHPHDWRANLASGEPRAWIAAGDMAAEYILKVDLDAGASDTKESLQSRFIAHSSQLDRLHRAATPAVDELGIVNDVKFFNSVRALFGKSGTSDDDDSGRVAVDIAIQQILSAALSGDGVMDLYGENKMDNPDISLIDDSFVERFRMSATPNLQIEALRRLLEQEVSARKNRDLVTSKRFSEMLQKSIKAYRNKAITASLVIAELVELAKQMKAEDAKPSSMGIREDELAFYNALTDDTVARTEMDHEKLLAIAHELVELVRRDAKTDWNLKEQVRASLRMKIRALLSRHGYPPETSDKATKLVLSQAELFADLVNT
ncbi:type I restriction endonuclease subunit R [Arthrobacter sp. SO3]|uniref:type I restriction endonuclease subunit R n=1 Tax=Arthrobacter sp. SO3 TaxID=1897057 RepID=UPI001CFF54A1|nr:type I restriction endonuclease subunit R [Arthrobacter sp. SO3]MCB5292070.1 Type-1 restriction enzyme R protein [Arthrobacter sp. SO3]